MPDWMTYAEIGKRFGLGTEAARTRVRRLGWRTQPGNDGRTLALVPEDADLRPGGDRDNDRGDDRDDDRYDRPVTAQMTGLMAGALAALEDAVATLREQLERTEQDRDGERQRADELRTQLEALNAEMASMRAEADKAADLSANMDAALALADRVTSVAADAVARADRAEAAITGERQRADALRDRIEAMGVQVDELRAGQAMMADMHARELAVAQHDAEPLRQAATRRGRRGGCWRGSGRRGGGSRMSGPGIFGGRFHRKAINAMALRVTSKSKPRNPGISAKAIARAKKALERASWLRNQPKK